MPFVHASDLKPGGPEQLSPRIIRLIADNAGPFTYTGTGTYLLTGHEETVVVDPGPHDPEHCERIVAAAPRPISKILITHTHRDHCGGANLLKDATGASSFGFGPHPSPAGSAPPALDEGADFEFAPDEQLSDGDVIAVEGLTLRAVHTPGHISNHLCFSLEEEEALFTGDHIMGWATTVVAPPDGNMAEYMESLEALLRRRDRVYYPTHGAPITDPLPFVKAVKEHRLARDSAIMDLLKDGARTIPELVDAIYVGLAAPLQVAAGLNVKAHLDMHVARREVTEVGGGRYRLTEA